MAILDCFVLHGLSGEPARFRSELPHMPARGQSVVVHTSRGLELGQVLRSVPARPNASCAGHVVRLAQPDDLLRARALAEIASALLRHAQDYAVRLELPVSCLDAEVLLQGDHAVVQIVRWGECDLRDLVRLLSHDLDLSLEFQDLSPPVPSGCGSCSEGGTCGSTGCTKGDCSKGSCGSVSAEEVRAYFASLRQRMEQRRVPLL